jgi:hypothetical protein
MHVSNLIGLMSGGVVTTPATSRIRLICEFDLDTPLGYRGVIAATAIL